MAYEFGDDYTRVLVDRRTVAGRVGSAQAEAMVERAIALREQGATVGDIAKQVGVSPPTVSMWLPRPLWYLTNYELADRREAAATGQSFEIVRTMREAERAAARHARAERKLATKAFERMLRRTAAAEWNRARLAARAKLRRERNEERRRQRELRGELSAAEGFFMRRLRMDWQIAREEARTILRAERQIAREEARTILRAERQIAREEARSERQRRTAEKLSRRVWRGDQYGPQRVSFDFTSPDGGFRLAEHIAAPNSDPADMFEEDILAEILGDLDVGDIARMDDYALHNLRERLLAEGFAPGGVQQSERDRLRDPVRKRGQAPAPERTRMSTQHKHRKPGHQSSAGGSRSSRKARKRWARDGGEW